MKLSLSGISNKKEWEDKGYDLPKFDIASVSENTKKNPEWVHFGGGNLFRAFHAALSQDMLEKGYSDKGVIVIEGFDYEIIEKSYRNNDNLSVLVTLKSDGSIGKRVIGSVSESCVLDSENGAEFDRLKEIFTSPSLKMATFTITEKGYSIVNAAGTVAPAIISDFTKGPERPLTYMGKVTALLYARFKAGRLPITMLSTDNCSHNGDKLYGAVSAFAKAWGENGKAEKEFLDYINDPARVSFPWSMIDKITPRPDASVEDILRGDSLEGLDPVVTTKGTYVAPFVNAEETQYLVVEDNFPNGRPALDKVGVIFTDRETVDKVEKMKVCTCLNPLHTALAVYGCLLGFTRISDEMKDADLKKLVEIIGYKEGLPVVVDPGVLDPKEFIDTVLNVRVPNPFMPDTPQRIATDTSQKLPIRFGETIKNYIARGMNVGDLKCIPFVFAGWLRYLMAVDDSGKEFKPSDDPRLEASMKVVAGIKLGDKVSADALKPLLEDATIWGVDLFKAGLAELVTEYFNELIAGTGAVRKALHKIVG